MPNKNHRILCMNMFFSKELPNILKGRLFWFRRLHIVQDWFVKSSREMYDVSKERLAWKAAFLRKTFSKDYSTLGSTYLKRFAFYQNILHISSTYFSKKYELFAGKTALWKKVNKSQERILATWIVFPYISHVFNREVLGASLMKAVRCLRRLRRHSAPIALWRSSATVHWDGCSSGRAFRRRWCCRTTWLMWARDLKKRGGCFLWEIRRKQTENRVLVFIKRLRIWPTAGDIHIRSFMKQDVMGYVWNDLVEFDHMRGWGTHSSV